MTNAQLSLRLARLMVAAAWADGELHPKERTFLVKTLESMPGLTGSDLVEVNELLESPTEEDERDRIVADVIEVIKTPEDKALVMDLVSGMVAADGIVRPPERALIDEVRQALEGRSTGIFRRLSRLVGAVLSKIPAADVGKR